MTVAAIRAGIKSNLSTVTTVNRFDFEHKNPPAQPSVTISWPDRLDPAPVQGTGRDLTIPVRFEVPWDDDESSDALLESLMDSAVAAIESDRTLGGACDDLRCLPFTDIGARRLPDETVVMQFVIPVEVFE